MDSNISNITQSQSLGERNESEKPQLGFSNQDDYIELPAWVDEYLDGNSEEILNAEKNLSGFAYGHEDETNHDQLVSESTKDSGRNVQSPENDGSSQMDTQKAEAEGTVLPSLDDNEENELDDPVKDRKNMEENDRKGFFSEDDNVEDKLESSWNSTDDGSADPQNEEEVSSKGHKKKCKSKIKSGEAPDNKSDPSYPIASDKDLSVSPDVSKNHDNSYIDLESNHESSQHHSNLATFLQMYIDALYILRLSPYNSDGRNPRGEWNYALYAIVITTGTMRTLFDIKNVLAFGEKEKILYYYISLGYHIITLLLKLCFAVLLTFRFKKISHIIQTLVADGRMIQKKMVTLLIVLLLCLSTLTSLSIPVLSSLGKLDAEDRTIKNVVLIRSYLLSRDLFLWSRVNQTNQAMRLASEYFDEISPTTLAMGFTSYLLYAVSFTLGNVIRDFALVIAGTLCALCISLENKLKEGENTTPVDLYNTIWVRYINVQEKAHLINDCFWALFYFLAGDNLLYFAYCLYKFVILEKEFPEAMAHLIVLVKLIAFYVIALRAVSVNSLAMTIAQKSFTDSNDIQTKTDIVLITQGIEKDPIGIGSGFVFVDGSFILKFTTVLGSFFTFFADLANDLMNP